MEAVCYKTKRIPKKHYLAGAILNELPRLLSTNIEEESKAIFDVLFSDPGNPGLAYGISCKMRSELNRIDKDGRVTVEVSNSAGIFWNHLNKSSTTQANYREAPGEVGKLVIEQIEQWHKEVRTNNAGTKILQKGKVSETVRESSGKVDFNKSSFLVLSYNTIGVYQLHQFVLDLPNPETLEWEFTASSRRNSGESRRLVGKDKSGVLFEWYGESGGQLKYYPIGTDAIW